MSKSQGLSRDGESNWWRSRRVRWLGLVSVVLGSASVGLLSHRSAAQPVPPRARGETTAHLRAVVAEVPLDDEAVAAIRSKSKPTFAVTLPDRSRVVVVVDRVEEKGRSLSLLGHLDGQPGSSAVVTVVGEALAGNLRGKGDVVHVIAMSPEGKPVIRAVDPRKLPPDDPGRPIRVGPGHQGPRRDPNADTCTTDDPGVIQLMLLYSKQSRVVAGGVDAIEAIAYAALAESNQANLDSDISSRIELVHLAEVDYTATDTISDTVRLHDAGDGFLDDVHALRDLYRADVVAMFAQNTDYCGFSYGASYGGVFDVVRDPGNLHEEGAFVTFELGCVQTNLTLPHELAHLGSARHGWAADASDNFPTHANHGHVAGATFRTIMSTPFESSAPRVPNFSNPAISRAGVPTGSSSEPQPTDNHAVLNLSAPILANYRCSSPPASNVWMKDTWGDTGLEPTLIPASCTLRLTSGPGARRTPWPPEPPIAINTSTSTRTRSSTSRPGPT